MANKNLLALGGVYVDINTPHFPFDEEGLRPETEIVGGSYIFEAGGSAPNFVRLCSSLEISTTFIGKVGDDFMGQVFRRLLEESDVTPALVVDPKAQTNISMNVINSRGKSIMLVAGTGNQLLQPEEIEKTVSERLSSVEYLYLSGCFKLLSLLPAFSTIVGLAKERGVKVVLDHGRVHNGVTEEQKETVKQLALQADYYLPSAEEFTELWEVSALEEGLQKVAASAAGVLVLKNGDEGALTVIDGAIERLPAFKVTPLHTIGAGDSFNAGFIAARQSGMSIYESIRFACATAALKISQTDLPSREQVVRLLNEQ